MDRPLVTTVGVSPYSLENFVVLSRRRQGPGMLDLLRQRPHGRRPDDPAVQLPGRRRSRAPRLPQEVAG